MVQKLGCGKPFALYISCYSYFSSFVLVSPDPDCRDPEGIPESWKPAKRPPVFGEGSSVVIQYECKEGYTADAFGALIATCLMDGTVELREDYKCSSMWGFFL